MSCDSICVAEYVFLILWLVSVPTYFILLYILIKYRKAETIKSSFFRLSISLGIADLAQAFHMWLSVKWPVRGYFRSFYLRHGHIIAGPTIVIQAGLGSVQRLGVMLLTLNRFTSLVFPLQYKQIWTKRLIIIVVLFQWLIPCVTVGPFLTLSWTMIPQPNNVSVVPFVTNNHDRSILAVFWKVQIIWSVVRVLYHVVCYGVAFLKVYLHRNVAANGNNNSGFNRMEFRISLAGFIIVSVEIITFIYHAVGATLVSSDGDLRTIAFQASVLYDIFSLINPWALLIMCQGIREHYAKVFGCQSNQIQPTAPKHINVRPTPRANVA